MATGPVMSYATVSMALRAPRAVVVFDGGDHWEYWARRALYMAGQVWGGCGFVVIPHHEGEVNPTLLRACQTYDPDFVVTFPRTVGELEQLVPGQLPIVTNGQALTGQERDRVIAQIADNDVPNAADNRARELIGRVCSPYRSQRLTGTPQLPWHEDMTVLNGPGDRNFSDPFQFGAACFQDAVLACPPNWGGLLGAAVASQAGVVEAPEPSAVEPAPSAQAMNRLQRWLLGVRGSIAPEELVWSASDDAERDLSQMSTAHRRTMTWLVPVTSGVPYGRSVLAVVGDTPEDFALAHLWRLTFGDAVWLPSALGVNQNPLPNLLSFGMDELAQQLGQHAGKLFLTSISQSDIKVDETHSRLRNLSGIAGMGGLPAVPLSTISSKALPWKESPSRHLAIEEEFDNYVTVPTVLDEDGTRSMAVPLPAPSSRHLGQVSQLSLTWHVDISWRPNRAVRGRGLDGQAVFTPDTEHMLTWGRSSRDGASYQSHRFNFVHSGTPAVNKLARPAMRDLSLSAWVAEKCREYQISTQISDAGRRTALLTRLLGGRQQFVDLFGGELLPALRALLPTSPSSSMAYPNQDGVALASREGVLNFDGFCTRSTGLDRTGVRVSLDAALRAGVIRRGLVLQCSVCEQKQFQTIEKLGQVWTCVRCDAAGDLVQRAWKMPADEPTWYYDLHPVGRQVLRDHGEVPALLSAHLSNNTTPGYPPYQDIEEVEFVEEGRRKAEVDLIAYSSDTLVVAECKSSDHLPRDASQAREEIRKKCQAAAWLSADELIFATTEPSWTHPTQALIRRCVGEFGWGPLGPPEIRLVVGLGTSPAESTLILNGPDDR